MVRYLVTEFFLKIGFNKLPTGTLCMDKLNGKRARY